MFRAALWSRSRDTPHSHSTQRSESFRCSNTRPHPEQVFDVSAGVLDLLPGGERGPAEQSDIDSDRFPGLGQGFPIGNITNEPRGPRSGVADDPTGLDCAFDGSVPTDGDATDPAKSEPAAID